MSVPGETLVNTFPSESYLTCLVAKKKRNRARGFYAEQASDKDVRLTRMTLTIALKLKTDLQEAAHVQGEHNGNHHGKAFRHSDDNNNHGQCQGRYEILRCEQSRVRKEQANLNEGEWFGSSINKSGGKIAALIEDELLEEERDGYTAGANIRELRNRCGEELRYQNAT